jgi:hypothetical protein
MTLLDDFPERFGWRYWTVLAGPEQPARLMSPWLSRVFNGPRVDAECPHSNRPPPPDCWCGLHYVPYTHTEVFFPWICEVVNGPNKPPYSRCAIAFGAALGTITADADRGGSYRAKRAEGYLILTTFIHEDHAQYQDELRNRHWRPTLVGISERLAVPPRVPYPTAALAGSTSTYNFQPPRSTQQADDSTRSWSASTTTHHRAWLLRRTTRTRATNPPST